MKHGGLGGAYPGIVPLHYCKPMWGLPGKDRQPATVINRKAGEVGPTSDLGPQPLWITGPATLEDTCRLSAIHLYRWGLPPLS